MYASLMERTLSETEMNALLQSEVYGHLACSDNGKPYIVPLAYVFQNGVLYGQTTEGKKVEILRRNPLVCFQVQQQKENEWRSIMCWGSFEEFEFEKLDETEVSMVAELLTNKLGSIQENVGIGIPQYAFEEKTTPLMVNHRTSILFRIVVTEKTGKLYEAGK
jgi:nitroimidazol reductase NimA-like FMN-containing flavoprotein (pyridoxamine 5'-phosphate oxidase superfamily)